MLAAVKLLEASTFLWVSRPAQEPLCDPVGAGVRAGWFLHLLSAEGGVKWSDRGAKAQATASTRPGHCFRKQGRCSELVDIFLGHQAEHLAKRKHIFPKRPRFYKCQLFQNIFQVPKGSGGGVWGGSFHQHQLFLLPSRPDDL